MLSAFSKQYSCHPQRVFFRFFPARMLFNGTFPLPLHKVGAFPPFCSILSQFCRTTTRFLFHSSAMIRFPLQQEKS